MLVLIGNVQINFDVIYHFVLGPYLFSYLIHRKCRNLTRKLTPIISSVHV